MKVVNLKCNGCFHPIQVDSQEISFSWNIISEVNGTKQSAYEITVTDGITEMWNTKKIKSSDNIYIPYEGKPLKVNSRYYWKVRVWNEKNEISEWSHETFFETGMMKTGWKAEWIGYDRTVGEPFNPSTPFYCADDFEKGVNRLYLPPVPYIRKEFKIKKNVTSAKIYISAFGLAEVMINGKKVGTDHFVPGLSDYKNTVYYRTYHIEELLNQENITVGILLADGWYAGYIGLNNREWYGSKPRVMVQMELKYLDGTSDTLCSDKSWKASYGPIIEADIFQGEKYDARKEFDGWYVSGYNDSDWDKVDTGAENPIVPISHPGLPVVEHDHVFPKEVRYLDQNNIIVDFGRYICGVGYYTVKGTRGSGFTIKHSEILGADKDLYLKGNRSARCQDEYICKGSGNEIFTPRFTYHGFRYAKITIHGEVSFIHIEGVQLGTQIIQPTVFTCSNETANAVYGMIRNTEKANLFEVPTDCCARDERLGWGMEGNHAMYAMAYMNNQYSMTKKWAKDIWDNQRANGVLEAIAPPLMMKDIEQFVGDLQSNHGIYMIYTLYKMYGDTQIIKDNFSGLQKYFEFMDSNSDRNIRYACSADWLGILETTDHSDVNHGFGECSQIIIGTAHYAIAAQMMVMLCHAIEKEEEALHYHQLYLDIAGAFQRVFLQRDGTIRNGKQGDYLIALAGGLIPEQNLLAVKKHFEEELTKSGYVRWFGGTTTTPYFLHTLKNFRREDLANQFLCSVKYPSIGYMQSKGFDTIWERWDSIYEDGTIHPQVMNAFCHEGFTVVAEYIISGLAGIDSLEAGFKKILISPGLSKEITAARASYDSTYGIIKSDWKWEKGKFSLICFIPSNTSAEIEIPSDDNENVTVKNGSVKVKKRSGGKVIVEADAGYYEFVSKVTGL